MTCRPRALVTLITVSMLAADGRAGNEMLSAGVNRTLAVTSDGRALQWGNTVERDRGCYCSPGPVSAPDDQDLTGIVAVAASYHSMALGEDGTVWTWGETNSAGQLGRGDVGGPTQHVAQRVLSPDGSGTLGGITSIAAGPDCSLAVRGSDGSTWAWGANASGQLGSGAFSDNSPLPVQVRTASGLLLGVDEVTCGQGWALALVDGAVWTWGTDFATQRGGANSSVAVPVVGPGGAGQLSGIRAIRAGGNYALALRDDGVLLSWGDGYFGALGNNSALSRQHPEPVLGPDGAGTFDRVTDVAAGYTHVLALRDDGSAWAWGYGLTGSSGDGGSALGNGVPAVVDQPQRTPVRVVGVGGDGFLSGIERAAPHRPPFIAASAFAARGYSLAMAVDGTLRAWGSNNNRQLALPSLASTNTPQLVCEVGLRPLRPVVTCPSTIEAGSTYQVSWTQLPGAIGYEVEKDGVLVAQLGSNASFQSFEEPGPACVQAGDPPVRRFRVRALRTECEPVEDDWTAPCAAVVQSPFTAPPAAPVLACPELADAGAEFSITWPAALDALSWEADLDGDLAPDQQLAEPSIALLSAGVGNATVSVRGKSPCGDGAWSECTVRIRPDTSQCMTSDGIEVCGPEFVEESPGTFVVTSPWIRVAVVGAEPTDYTLWVDGSVEVTPSSGGLAFGGTAFLLTPAEQRFELFDSFGEAAGLSSGVHGGPHRCRLPTSIGDLTGPGDPVTCGLRNLLTGVPSTTERDGVFTISNLPYQGRVKIWVQKKPILLDFTYGQYFGCIVVEGEAGAAGVPENPGYHARATAALCIAPPRLRSVVDLAEVRMAGCVAQVTNGSLAFRTPGNPLTPLGVFFPAGTVSCPTLGNLVGTVNNVFVAPGILDIANGTAAMGAYDVGGLGVATLREASGAFAQRNPPALGYQICGNGQAGFRFLLTDIPFGFTLYDQNVQRACANLKLLREVEPLIPRLPIHLDRLGGCLRLTGATVVTSGACAGPDAIEFAPPAPCQPSCLTPPTAEVHVGLRLANPFPIGDGDLARLGPMDAELSNRGFRAGGNLRLLGRRVGTAELCASLDAAGACAAIDLGGVLSGSANLWIDATTGMSGRIDGEVDLPGFDFAKLWIDPPPFGVSVYVGPFEDDVPFVGKRWHWGPVTQLDIAWQKVAVGLDLRHLTPHVMGVRALGPLAGIRPSASLDAPDAAASFLVAEGQSQAIFSARSESGAPEVTLLSPGGARLDESSADVKVLSDATTRVLAVREPEAGSWTVEANGTGPIEITALTQPPSASAEATEPATTGSSRHVAWTGVVPGTSLPRTLRVVAAKDASIVGDGAGFVLHATPLVEGPGGFDVPDGALPDGTWTVGVVTDDGEGGRSISVADGAIVIVDDDAPLPPEDASASSLADGAWVSWSASTSPDVAGYDVIVAEAGDPASGVAMPAGLATHLAVHGLAGVQPRRYFVRAFDTSGNESAPADAGIVAPDPTRDADAPAAPAGLVVVAIGTGVHATWDADADAATWRVHYGPSRLLVGRQAAEGASPVASDVPVVDLTGFESGQTVFIAISAVDAMGNEGAMSPVASVFIGSRDSNDGDALPDSWELLAFQSLEASDGAGDLDGDLLSDADELALGHDPLEPDAFAWGDLAPKDLPDGAVDIADVVRALRLSVGLEVHDADDLRRGNVAPSVVTAGVTTPTGEEPRRLTIADVVLTLRAVVGLTTFEDPVDET